jgi:hypothetical protein
MRNAYKISAYKPEMEGALRIRRYKWWDNIKMDLKRKVCESGLD